MEQPFHGRGRVEVLGEPPSHDQCRVLVEAASRIVHDPETGLNVKSCLGGELPVGHNANREAIHDRVSVNFPSLQIVKTLPTIGN